MCLTVDDHQSPSLKLAPEPTLRKTVEELRAITAHLGVKLRRPTNSCGRSAAMAAQQLTDAEIRMRAALLRGRD
jgi:hypothetical protein